MKYLKYFWLLIPAIPFFGWAFNNRPDRPAYDDYNAILEVVVDWKKFTGWDKFGVLFAQNNEHRILPTHLISILYYEVTGTLNFTMLAFIGDLQMFVIAIGGFYFIKKAVPKHWLILSFIWSLLVFDLNSYNQSDFAMEALANWGVIAMFISALVCFDKGWVWMGAVLQFFAIFSNGNGIPAAIIVVIFVLNGVEWYKMRYASLPLLLAPLYYINFQTQPHHVDIGKAIPFFISQCGAPFSFTFALPIGICVLCIIAWCLPIKQMWGNKKNMGLICILAFILISMAAAAIFRAADNGAQYQSPRYLIYPEMLIGITFSFLLLKAKKTKLVIAIAIPIFFISYCINYQFGVAMFAFEHDRYFLYQDKYKYWYPPELMDDAVRISNEAKELGVYDLDEH